MGVWEVVEFRRLGLGSCVKCFVGFWFSFGIVMALKVYGDFFGDDLRME